MKVPDSLQTFDDSNGGVFGNCSKLVPSDINVNDNEAVVTYLRSVQVRISKKYIQPPSVPGRLVVSCCFFLTPKCKLHLSTFACML